jgi:CheY-like chemotaxis protein
MPHILVIEDDIPFRHNLVQMLRLGGHEVEIASDGIEALELLQIIRPDLILTDTLMAGLDGVETIVELARRGIDTPVIAMSRGRRARTAEFDLDSAALLGVSAILVKPFARADLASAIEQALLTRRVKHPATI